MYFFKRTFFFILILGNLFAYSQSIKLDSLKSVLGSANNDSLKIQMLLEMANECRYYAPDDLRRFNRQALLLSEKTNFSLGEGLALKGLGKYFYDLGKYDSAMYYYTEAELRFREIGDKKELSNIKADFCYVCVAKGEYNKALDAGLSALQLAEETGDKEVLQNAYAFIGFTYFSSGNTENALEYLMNGLEIAEQRNDTKGIAFLKRDMAITYDESGEYDKAIKYYNESAELFRNLNDRRSLGIALFNIAEVYRCQDNLNEAIKSFHECFLIASELADNTGKNLVLINLANTYIEMFRKGNSMVVADEMIKQTGFQNIDDLLITTSIQLKKNNNRNHLVTNLLLLVELNTLRKDYEQAYKFNIKLIKLREELAQINTANALAELINRFEMQQMEKELHLLEAQTKADKEQITIQRQQQLIIIIITVLLVIVGFMLRSRIRTIRKTKEEIQKKNEQFINEKTRAEKSEKFKEQFLTKVSHEIRTPMNAIMGITNLLIKNKHLNEQEKYLDAINISARHLLVLINDILDLSKLESGKYEFEKTPFRVSETFDKVKTDLNPSAKLKKNIFSFYYDDKIPKMLLGDQYMLQQILINLCRNAIEYTNKGRIDVACKLIGTTEKVAILGFTVKDTGIGINKELHDKIFNSFIGEVSFDKKSFNQSGLELVIMRQMLELQGGKITVDSQPGLGTTFYFEIPYEINVSDKKAKKAIKKKLVDTDQAIGIKILLVEDNEFNVMVAKEELEDSLKEVRVDVAGNGEIALEMIDQNDYDIILMDVQMPVMNGYDATRAIRKMDNQKRKIPIIAMTANIMKSEVEKCFEAGMNAYIPKPFQRDELLQRIQENLKS